MPPLSLDEAIELFRERSLIALRAVQANAVAQACLRLDGIPLAVELAAAWTTTLSPSQIVDGLDDRFALLVRSGRGTQPRHQTLTASMEWSYDLLDEPERALLRRLGVFAASFTLDLASRVCDGPPIDGAGVRVVLGRLIDKSLVVAETAGAEARYRLLESVREFAWARLCDAGEQEVLRRRQVAELRTWMRDLRPVLDEQVDLWRSQLLPLAETLQSAVEDGLEHDDPLPARELAAELAHLWHSSVFGGEGLRLLRRALAGTDRQRTGLTARLLAGLALVADTTAPLGLEYDAAQAAFDIAEEVGDRRTAALSLLLSAVGAFYSDLTQGESLAHRAQQLGAEVGYPYVEAGATALLGIIAHLRDQHESAGAHLTRAVTQLQRLGERGIVSTALGFLALSALYTGRFSDAVDHSVRAVEMARPLNDFHRVGSAAGVRAIVQAGTDDLAGARATLDPLRGMLVVEAEAPFVPVLVRAVGLVLARDGSPSEAVAWLERWSPREAEPATYLSAEAAADLLGALRRAGESERARSLVDDALASARKLGLPRVVAGILDECAVLGEDHTAAEACLFEALSIRAQHGLRPDLARSLAGLADRWESCGKVDEAAVLRDALATNAACGDKTSAVPGPGIRELDQAREPLSLEDAAAFALRSRGPRRRPSTGWSSLTPTEREVVRLAALGLTNPEIASRLFISRATVKTHLGHVFGKLGVSNRTELASALAAQKPTIADP